MAELDDSATQDQAGQRPRKPGTFTRNDPRINRAGRRPRPQSERPVTLDRQKLAEVVQALEDAEATFDRLGGPGTGVAGSEARRRLIAELRERYFPGVEGPVTASLA